MPLSLQLGHACRSGPASCWHAPNGCLVRDRLESKSVSYLWQIADSKNKADSVQDIWLSRAVQACNGVEFRIPTGDMGTRDIWLEAFYNKFLQVHGAEEDQVALSRVLHWDSNPFQDVSGNNVSCTHDLGAVSVCSYTLIHGWIERVWLLTLDICIQDVKEDVVVTILC